MFWGFRSSAWAAASLTLCACLLFAPGIVSGGNVGYHIVAGADGVPLRSDTKTPFKRAGFNVVDLFWRSLDWSCEPWNITKTMEEVIEDLEGLGLGDTYVRFAASPFWPAQLKQTLLGTQAQVEAYWRSMDAVFDAVEANSQLKLVPSILFNMYSWPDAFGEELGAVFEDGSETHRAMEAYASDFVARYKSRPSVLFWEIGNEFNLWVDIALKPSWNVRPLCGTPKARSSKVPYTTPELRRGIESFAQTIRVADGSARLISSGLTIPYKCSYHNRYNLSNCVEDDGEPGDYRKQDNAGQWSSQLTAFHPPTAVDLMSVHIYATNGHNVRLGYTERWGADVLGFLTGVAAANGQSLFLGEYGSPWPNKFTPDDPFVYADNVLNALVKYQVPLSTIWVFECDIRCNKANHNDLRPLPPYKAIFEKIKSTNRRLHSLANSGAEV